MQWKEKDERAVSQIAEGRSRVSYALQATPAECKHTVRERASDSLVFAGHIVPIQSG